MTPKSTRSPAGSIVDHYGTPAIKSTKGKHDPNLPIKHWWITEPVAEAIAVAEQLSEHHDRLFPPLQRKSADVSRSHQMLDAFINHVNATSARTGLQPIPPGKTRPHMFRRTMAMLTDQFPGSEIALGIQLKHIASRALANRSTQGYANADNSWAAHLESAIDAARFRRIEDLYHAHKTGEPIGYGPGADRIAQTFNDIQHSSPSTRWRRNRRTSHAPQSPPLHPVRHPQPLRHGREQPGRRRLPGKRRHPRRPQRTATRPMPTRPMRQQRHRPRTPADLGDRATHPANPHQHARAVDLPQRRCCNVNYRRSKPS